MVTEGRNPQLICQYWETNADTKTAMDYFECGDLGNLVCTNSRPGEYFIGTKLSGIWQKGIRIQLINGSKTIASKVETKELFPPKTRKGVLIYWSGGYWVKHTSKGKEKINPLDVQEKAVKAEKK